MRVHSESVNSLLVIFVSACGHRSELVGLGIIVIESLFACESLLLKNSNLLLDYRLCSLGNLDNVSSVLSVQNERLVDLSRHRGLEARNHIRLSHPADVALLTVSGRTVVSRELSRKSREILTCVKHIQKTVSLSVSLGTLKKNMLHIHRVRNHRDIHHFGGEELVT